MAYEMVSVRPAGIAGQNGPGFLGALGEAKTAAACPPFKIVCDVDCPFPAFLCGARKQELCDRILGAINLAKRAAARLETKPLSQNTLDLFRQVFGQAPSDPWEVPGQPSRTMPAGVMVAQRLRTVARELETRDTIYRCVSAKRCPLRSSGGSGTSCLPDPGTGIGFFSEVPPSPSGTTAQTCHTTDSIVIDAAALALLCKNEVWLCPPFWQMKKEWQEGTILHEMLHLCFGVTCAWFQHDQKERKRNSANCYEVFAVSGVAVPDPASINACNSTPQ